MYGGMANITRRAPLHGLTATQPIDEIYGKPLYTKQQVDEVHARLRELLPLVTVWEIMCTVFSNIQTLNYWWRPDELIKRKRQMDYHINAMCDTIEYLLERGCHILLENPFPGGLWKHPRIQKLRRDYPQLIFVQGHMCPWGARGKHGLLLLKPSGWLASHPRLASAVDARCPGEGPNHVHGPVMGGSARMAGVYTEELADSILEAAADIAKEMGDPRFTGHTDQRHFLGRSMWRRRVATTR
jgi:hypothetical protein